MIAVGALVGALLGLLAVPAVRRLPRGIPERLAQPAWTRHAGRPAVLIPVGATAGTLLGATADAAAGLALGLVLLAVLLPAAAIDVAWRVVPDTLVVAGAAGSAAVVLLVDRDALVPHLVAAAIGGVAALAVALAARGGFGLGDVKLIAMAGVALGAALPLAVALAVLAAGVVAVPLLARGGRGATLPLAPFLALGIVVAAAYGDTAATPL